MGLEDSIFLYLGTFGGDILGYRWKQCFQELAQEYLVIKLDLAQAATSPPLMDMVGDVGPSILASR